MPVKYNLDQIEELSIDKIHEMYRNYVNYGQVNLLSSFSPARLLVEKAEGQYIYLKNGTKVSDFTAGIGVLNHGHNHPRILKARVEFQKHQKMEVHKNFLSPYLAALAHSISTILPESLCMSYFCNSGAEAVEGAVKLAYKSFNGSRSRIAAADIAFHGKLLGSAGLTGSPEIKFNFPTIPNIDRFKYNDIESVRSVVEGNLVSGQSSHYAIIIEPFNASNVQECGGEFLEQLRNLCSHYQIPLIFDEVYTGWAKTGDWFYFLKHGVTPDLLSMSKSFGGGKSSISGFVATRDIFDAAYGRDIDATLHSTTYNGFGEECITALEAISIIDEENLNLAAQNVGEYILPKLTDLALEYPEWLVEARGTGALMGLVLNSDISPIFDRLLDYIPFGVLNDTNFRKKLVVSSVIHELFEQHQILTYFGSNVDVPLIIAPTLMSTEEDWAHLIYALRSVFKKKKYELILKFAAFKYGKKYLK
ncbi:aminotransferase class III-fold pyridoxal phosphate-dependent enzyme [Rhodobacterales bacterium LSUCC0387]|nr:aminotransferase class III-fold pyridoxal phosphate-dependent enzyme [Rhodobacterales bacterium LSUCC0387]